ncbi:hypothetical protein MBLNU459_g2611t1 [Dothideomycetes sp. NU459]
MLKRTAQEAFSEPKQPMSAFAAAKAKASKLESITSSHPQNILEMAERNIKSGAAEQSAAFPTLLSSFPLSSTQTVAELHSDDEGNEAAQFSSDDNGDDSYEDSIDPDKSIQSRKLSTLGSDGSCIISDQTDRLTLRLQQDETATLVGEYDLRVITGIVIVYGAVLRPSHKSHRVYAPSTHALPVITAKGGVAEIAIVSSGPSLGRLSKLSPLWGRLWNGQNQKDPETVQESTMSKSFALLRTASDDVLKRALTPLEIEQDVHFMLNKILTKPSTPNPPVILISGPKGSGKSTLSRYLGNTALTLQKAYSTIFYLDLDPGQPEFLTPGQLSLLQLRSPLFGPPFTHPTPSETSSYRLIRSHTLAATSPKDDTTHYLACAVDLRERYQRLLHEFPGAPCIVNCSGWVQGSAVPVLLGLVQRMGVSDVVLLQPMDNATVAEIEAAVPKANVVCVNARAKGAVQSRTSAEMRAMQAMSYFHSVPGKATEWDERPLTQMQSWRVKYSGPDAGITAIVSYGEVVDPAFLATVLDGMVVAVCVVESEDAFGPAPPASRSPASSSPSSSAEEGADTDADTDADADADAESDKRFARTPENLPYLLAPPSGLVMPLDPRFSRCIGVALIRGIDTENEELQLLTPISAAEIKEITDPQRGGKIVLVRGKFDPPDWAYLEDVHGGKSREGEMGDRPYVAERDAQKGLAGNVWRVRHLPRNFGT